MIVSKELIAYSNNFSKTRHMIRAYLKDVAPEEIRTINILLNVYESGIAKELYCSDKLSQNQYNNYIKRLVRDYGMNTKAAIGALNEWIDICIGKGVGSQFENTNTDGETFEEHFVSVPEQGGGKLIPEEMCNLGQVYTVSRGKSGMIGVFRLESQMLPGSGKFEKTGIGTNRDAKEATNVAFNFLKANGNRISDSISTTTKDYCVDYQDLQGIGMTDKLALPSLIALASIAIGKPALSSLAVLGEISIVGTVIKVDELASTLQVCRDCGAKKVLLPITSAVDLGSVSSELVGSFNLIFYSSAEDAVFKAMGEE